MSALYQQALLAHHQSPVGFNLDIKFDSAKSGHNPACGDEITVKVAVTDGVITDIAFDGDSCAICRASASIMCEQLKVTPFTQAKNIADKLIAGLESKENLSELLGDSYAPLNAVASFPIRAQCAQLPWQTFQLCFEELKP
ncbi:MAG: SUF system NifU family Fe-S cluster assembly protein [Colwelliaceae bacterium]|nr:SUF system NifU family Fe-S cluster assembly protein [Colwelliaceae bacterium]